MKNNYKVILTMCGVDYSSEAETLNEALAGLALSWNQIKNKGVIKVIHGDYTAEKLFYIKQLRRIFANKIFRLITAKRLELFLKENKLETAEMPSGE